MQTTGPQLTERERDVLELLATYMTRSRIARELRLSPNTIKTHIRHIYERLGVNGRDDAVIRARLLGLLPEIEGNTERACLACGAPVG